MSLKRIPRYGLLGVLVLAFCVPALFFLSGPAYLNSAYFYRIIHHSGIKEFVWTVRRIGLTGSDIGSLRIGPSESPALSVNAVQISYSPAGLLRKEVGQILVSGLEFRCGIRAGKFFIRGLDPEELIRRFPKEKSPPSPAPRPSPVSLKGLEIRHALVIFEWDDRCFRIPLDLSLTPHQGQWKQVHGTLRIFPGGQTIAAGFALDLSPRTLRLDVQTRALETARFADLAARIPGLILAGELDLDATATFQLEPFRLTSAQVACEFRNTGSACNRFKLWPFQKENAENTPARLKFSSKDGKEWQFSAESLGLVSPVPVLISHAEGRLRQDKTGLTCSGNMTLALEKSESDLPLRVTEPMILNAAFAGTLAPEGSWHVRLSPADSDVNPPKGWNVKVGTTELAGAGPEIEAEGQGKGGEGKVRYNIRFPEFRVKGPDADVRTPLLALKGDLHTDTSGTRGDFRLTAPQTRTQADKITVRLPEVALSGKIKAWFGEPPRLDGDLTLSEGRFDDTGSGVRVSGVAATFPFHWPWQASEKKGKIAATAIRWRQMNLGAFSGEIKQSAAGLTFGGRHRSKLVRGAVVNVAGSSAFFSQAKETRIRVDTRYKTASPLDLGKFHKQAKGIRLSGQLAVTGDLVSDRSGVTLGLESSLTDADLRSSGKGFALEDINLTLNMSDLLALRSAPGQQLKIGNISVGNIRMSDADLRFQIESAQSFLIEKGRFRWCDGNVNAQALRIVSGLDDYDLILYCDRLKLARVLEQLGGARADGEGAVNGRIPIRWQNGTLVFDDGFLYSTPGEGGTIHLTGADFLTRGIPRGSPQFNQIDLAREALKEYEYQWVRLKLASEGEDLMLRMEFDGKPVRPLPFVYKKDFGGFMRMESGGQLSRFQGIRLNVNLSLPLNKILRYKGIWNTINQP